MSSKIFNFIQSENLSWQKESIGRIDNPNNMKEGRFDTLLRHSCYLWEIPRNSAS